MFSYLIKLQLKYQKEREKKKKERGEYSDSKESSKIQKYAEKRTELVIIQKRGGRSLHLHFKPIFIIFVLKEKL